MFLENSHFEATKMETSLSKWNLAQFHESACRHFEDNKNGNMLDKKDVARFIATYRILLRIRKTFVDLPGVHGLGCDWSNPYAKTTLPGDV